MTRGSDVVLLECVTGVRMVSLVCVASGGVGVMAIVSLLLMFEGKDVEAESTIIMIAIQ